MRKRKIQSISLKLSELKEYDAVKQERLERSQSQNKDKPPEGAAKQPQPIAKVGPKTKQEIRERIGLD